MGSSSPLLRAVVVEVDWIESVFPWSSEFLWFEDDVERVSSTGLVLARSRPGTNCGSGTLGDVTMATYA